MRRVALGLDDQSHAELVELARLERRSLSNMARALLLEALGARGSSRLPLAVQQAIEAAVERQREGAAHA